MASVIDTFANIWIRESSMTEQDFHRRLYEAGDSNPDALSALAKDLDAEIREPVRTILAAWRQDPGRRRINCAYICAQLKELAIGEMLKESEAVPAVTRVQLMEMVVSQQLRFRELVLTALEPLLMDHGPASLADEDSEFRANDVAYLTARKLVFTKEAEAKLVSSEKDFKGLAAEDRDTEINTWLFSETWRELFRKP